VRLAMVTAPILEYDQDNLRPAYMDGYRNNPHLGPYLLGGILARQGYDVQMVDLVCRDVFDPAIAEELAEYDAVFLSANSCNWSTCALLVSWIRQTGSRTKIVLGGIHATLFGQDVIERFPVDCVVRGEGERVLLPLLRALETGEDWDRVPGLLFMDHGTLCENALPPLLSSAELDALPMPLYEQMPPQRYKTLAIESSRGCRGDCLFCAIPYRRQWRPISAEAFVAKVEALQPYISQVELEHLSVVDDCFTIDRSRVLRIIDRVESQGLDFHATYDARIVDFLDEELVERLAPHSRGVLVGAESFLPDTLRRIRKPVTPDTIVECARVVSKYGMSEQMVFSFIIGFPWETKREIQENLSRIVDLAFTYGVRIFLQWHMLTPGSAIWHALYAQQQVSPSDMDEVGFLRGKKWFDISSSLSVEERLDISDMVMSVQKVMMLTKPLGSQRGDIVFIVPPYLTRNKEMTQAWRDAYEQAMARLA
jgi:anaerobic magnesium-protoporphyrin IX monomethyl ester cyclase